MASAALKQMVNNDAIFLPLTVSQYHAMISNGILPEGAPYELLDGFLVRKDRGSAGDDPMTVNYGHAWVVKTLAELSKKFTRIGCHLQTQQPITMPPSNEPEPDAAVVVGALEDYRSRHPEAKDVRCVIEVADTSLNHDRHVKGRLYATAGIPQFVIVNLSDRVVEVYSEPQKKKGIYLRSTIVQQGQRIAFLGASGRTLKVTVKSLLP